jgi:hypothetical protein
MDARYNAMRKPPADILKIIEAGNLKGKSDINPQWRIEVMTEQFGLCGIGWRYEIVSTNTVECSTGEILVFMRINLYVKDGDQWSNPIPGYGGDKIVVKNKNGLVPNDEAYKMVLTDALGNAMKNIGVAADVYRGLWDSKYSRWKGCTDDITAQVENNQPDKIDVYNEGNVRFINGSNCQVRNDKGQYLDVDGLSMGALQYLVQQEQYSAAHDALKAVLDVRSIIKDGLKAKEVKQ